MKFPLYGYNKFMNKKIMTGLFIGAIGALGILSFSTFSKIDSLQELSARKNRDLETFWVSSQLLDSSHKLLELKGIEILGVKELYCYQEGGHKVALLFNSESQNYSFYYVGTNLIQEGSFENIDELEKGEYSLGVDHILLRPKTILKKAVSHKLSRRLSMVTIEEGIPVEMNLLARVFRSLEYCDSIYNQILQLK